MSKKDTKRWNRKYLKMSKASNLAYSREYDTVGCVTGDNIYWSHHTRDELLTDFSLIHWHGITLSYTFIKKQLGVEPFDGGKIAAKDLEILLPRNKPLIENWDHIDIIPLPKTIDDPIFLQKIILLQEESIKKLKSKIDKLERKCLKLENV